MTGRVVTSGGENDPRASSSDASSSSGHSSASARNRGVRSGRSVGNGSGRIARSAASRMGQTDLNGRNDGTGQPGGAGQAGGSGKARTAGQSGKLGRTGRDGKVRQTGRTMQSGRVNRPDRVEPSGGVGGTVAGHGGSDAADTGVRRFVRHPRVTKAQRTPRSSRPAASAASAGLSPSPAYASSSTAARRNGSAAASAGSDTVPDRRPTRSLPGGFVDARGLRTDRAVGERLRSDDGSGPFRRPKIIGFTARAREERKARTLTVLIRVGIAALAAALVAALVWLLFFSPVLKLQPERISVQGANEWVSAEQVSSIAAEQAGRSLIVVSTGTIADRLKAMPGVTSAQVDKRWPHGLTITVAAQKPAAVLKSADGAMTAVDSQARVLNAVGASVAGIPVIDVDSVSAGLENRAVQQALQILASLPESMRQRIGSVTAKTQDSVTTVLDGGNYTIVWGDASQLTLKKAEVNKILGDPAVIGDKHQVDVTSPRKPIIK